jgi:hypothetical protein
MRYLKVIIWFKQMDGKLQKVGIYILLSKYLQDYKCGVYRNSKYLQIIPENVIIDLKEWRQFGNF